MKIAMIGQKGIPTKFGGVERHVEELSRRLGEMGHEVVVYTRAWYALPKSRFSKGVSTVATPTVRTKHLDAIVHTLTSTFHAIWSGADVIHYHGVGPSLLSWIPRLLSPGTKVVATFHSMDRRQKKWGLIAKICLGLGERAACLFPHATISISRTLQAYCRDRYDCEATYIPNGVSVLPNPDYASLDKFGLKRGRYLLMVSRLIRDKGVHYLIAAFKELKRRNLVDGMKLAIVGGSAFTDDYVAELKRMADDDPDIIFTGSQSGARLSALYGGAYALVHPSEVEGLPITVLEAMSFGKPVLGSDIPEIMEVLRDNGFSFRSKSVIDLARKLRWLIANPEVARAKGAAARRSVSANYRWDDIVKSVDGIYHQLTGERRHAEAALVERANS
jgi:glycosyltransferase involved in cell wall biosynthesis